MKKLSMITFVLFTSTAFAQGDRVDYCMNYAHVVNIALADRGIGFSPQMVYSQLKPMLKNVSDADKKNIINKVFFDPSLAYAVPDDQTFIGEVIGQCENNWKPIHQFKPLR